MKTYLVIRLCVCIVLSTSCIAQVPVNSVSTVNNIAVAGGGANQPITAHPGGVNGVQGGVSYDVSYNNNGNVNINSFVVAGKSYIKYAAFDTIILRRVANAWETTGGNKQQIYCEGPLLIDNLFHTMSFPVAFPQVTNHGYMERVMKEGYINRGSDNVFNNDPNSDQTFNNIERVDFVDKQGSASNFTTLAGFLIAERGGNDPFKIAAITAIDANGNPTAFGPMLSVTTASYGTVITTATTYVMRKDAADNVLRPFSVVAAQGIRSVYISFSHLGIAPLQKVYGYSLMANDVTATTSAEILNVSNSSLFPRNTTTTNGGMDLASAPGIFHTDLVLAGHFLTLNVRNENCQSSLSWTDMDHRLANQYQVERSADGENFEKVAAIKTTNAANYTYTDSRSTGSFYYRIKVMLQGGEEYYSTIVYSKTNCSGIKVSLFPNPSKNKLTLNYDSEQRIQQVTIVSLSGKEIGKWNVNDNSQQIQLDISALPDGQYFVRINDKTGTQKSYPFIKL